jgi:hypothetical protein
VIVLGRAGSRHNGHRENRSACGLGKRVKHQSGCRILSDLMRLYTE